ncbi:hypothetical protein CROQUDRAFT_108429 [Cronartium quercuum f. sp. fusiforme G11]|uniref:Uncharacterized protein n=1 Tax=Cronartium quercuum f. sp. fusiforme G11 TaxID=708437 RepID=A0A9P6TBH2_9BASI|nr:hypothetical protein CROQUDRAFT_108429 [Cronartium quercuum f. sp. fusiforme G11]
MREKGRYKMIDNKVLKCRELKPLPGECASRQKAQKLACNTGEIRRIRRSYNPAETHKALACLPRPEASAIAQLRVGDPRTLPPPVQALQRPALGPHKGALQVEGVTHDPPHPHDSSRLHPPSRLHPKDAPIQPGPTTATATATATATPLTSTHLCPPGPLRPRQHRLPHPPPSASTPSPTPHHLATPCPCPLQKL